jgi:hypothetical protein
VVRDVEYRWRATGNDDYISIGIWPANNVGPFIQGNLRYHETWIDNGDGSWTSAGNQVVISNRIIHRIIGHALAACGYDPHVRGKELNLRALDDLIEWHDAVRGS